MTFARHLRDLLAAVGIVASAPAAWAQSSFALEMRTLHWQYHAHPARLDAAREGLEMVAEGTPHVEDLLALAQVSFIWGDVRAVTTEQRLMAFYRGREAARRALALEPRNALAHFWLAVNTGRWGQTKGVLRSVLGLSTVREAIQTSLRLDPTLTAAYAVAGYLFAEVPGLFGGDLERAEEMFRTGLRQDPRFTGMRVGLAKTLIKKGRIDEARRELLAVLDEPTPSNPADWVTRDLREAQGILREIDGRS